MRTIAICTMLTAMFLPLNASAQYGPPAGPPVVSPTWINGVLTCPPGYRGPISSTPGGAEVCVRN
ncbi:MAG: hypothetical protein JO261_14850 [Alphaproteobacteria bacterium]|nr:hypothetical protein [Alphaproteobacteria bacterium]MBV9694974.1 hypothetical protein [Alphaproteobacteria bacterium]